MKTIVGIVLSVASFSLLAPAQEKQPAEPKTQLEAFSAKSGTVILKDYEDMGSVKGLGTISVTAMEFTDATTSKKQQGVVVEVTSGTLERESRSFIDFDEIDGLLNGIDYLLKFDGKTSKLPHWEATYSTRGDISIVAYNSSNKSTIEAAVKSGRYGATTAYISIKDLAELRALIERAKKKLEQVK